MAHRWWRKWLKSLSACAGRGVRKTSVQPCAAPRRHCVRPVLEMLEDRTLLSIQIQFDFSRDTNSFFGTNPQAQSVLQAAADNLTSRIITNLTAIVPGGSNTWTAITDHPSIAGQTLEVSNLNVPANTLIVYTGGQNLSGGTLGRGGPGGFQSAGSSAFLTTVATRGQAGANASPPTGFGPWGGSLTFTITPSGGWYFGTDPGQIAGKNDFYSIATHELGHLLGIGTADSWDTYVSSGTFVGPRSVASMGGPVPLAGGASHWAQSVLSQGMQPAMTPTLLQGTRKDFTPLDFAGLEDIGWQIQAPPPVMTPLATGPAGQFPTGLAVGDFNGDGKLDSAAANYGPTGGNSVTVLFGNGAGGFSSTTLTIPLAAGANPFGIAAGTLTTSGKLDLVTGNFAGQSISYIAGNGDGTFKAPVNLPAMDSAGGTHKIVQIAIGDLNGDAKQDIVATSGDGTYSVFLGNGNGNFNALPAKSALTPIFGAAIVSFDFGSGPKPGLVVGAFAANRVGVLAGNGDGTLAPPVFTLVGSTAPVAITPEFIAAGDFNQDGKIDVATSNKEANTASVLLGNGNGTFQTATTFAVGSTPLGIAAADLNKDGSLDLALANLGGLTTPSSVAVLYGNGNGTFTQAHTFAAGPFPIAVAAGDFQQGSITLDLAVANFFGNPHDTITLAAATSHPTIASFTPTSGPAGTPVIITGTNFLSVLAVTFNGKRATSFVVNSPTQITALAPTGASSGPISVATPGGVAVGAVNFTVTP